jgi:hypothetical protein
MTQALLTRGSTGRPAQRTTHRPLLRRVKTAPGRAPIDVVVVPAARDASRLLPAARLAATLGCPLVVLCSHDADTAAVHRATRVSNAAVIAVDVREVDALPAFHTSAVLAGTPFARRTDTSMKRNLGLALARMTGWQRILFLDDDISGVDAGAVMGGASLLAGNGVAGGGVVGLDNVGWADNSVVCHANRDTGGPQGTFVGAGAMLVAGSRATSFFPDIYNEDWFFLLDGERLVDVAVHGEFAQARFDPYVNPSRAGKEEFGDCLAEGIFALLDDGLTVAAANRPFWRDFLADRDSFIETVLRRLPSAPGLSAFRRTQIAAALREARASLSQITPDFCCTYLAAWRRDQRRWQEWVDGLPQGLPIDKALLHLGLG